ncbi:hypothetical protein NE237_007524 [Protea cynaroides]|uniref:Uncharacterized protein n=1 Tax=Protea cynaroides TaxID=273540 RepID=A0A9Q0QW71_9MAGN|nr:hypothetical protein NE237_007524 [Protea cynaroides]
MKMVYVHDRKPYFIFPSHYKEEACQLMDQFKREFASCTVNVVDIRSLFINLCRILRTMLDVIHERRRGYGSRTSCTKGIGGEGLASVFSAGHVFVAEKMQITFLAWLE